LSMCIPLPYSLKVLELLKNPEIIESDPEVIPGAVERPRSNSTWRRIVT
jgi:hypothetical protein